MTNIEANNPELQSWIEIPANSDFSIQNLPFGIFKTEDIENHIGVAIGDQVLDLYTIANFGYFEGLDIEKTIFNKPYLNDFISLGKETTRKVRDRISEILRHDNPELRDNAAHIQKALINQNEVEMLLPVRVGDYTDFYSSIEHATNVGTMFRDPDNALLPNWKHIPVGYHGRASSIIPSGVAIHRPKGQTKPKDSETPQFGPCKLLDFELETAFITYPGKELGKSISTGEADNFIFGLVLFNDWSARDIQTWEYVPLGPFLAKNFASSISPWVITLDALEPFRVAGPEQNPEVFPYLKYNGNKNIDLKLEVAIAPENSNETVVCNSNFKYMYWNMNQQLAHHTINGCNINCGDMMASGTISGKDKNSYGSMLELSWRGANPIKLNNGEERKFINDGDTVIMRGHAEKDGTRVGFGEVRTKVLPAIN